MTSIYEQLLGPDFARLGAPLQHVHGPAALVRAHGRVTVTHGRGWMARLSNWLTRVPKAGPDQPLTLEVQRRADGETWVRHFGPTELVTEQWAQDGLFYEAAGPVKMAMRLRVVDGALYFDPVKTKFMGLPLPGWAGPAVSAIATPTGTGWRVWVETKSRLMGLMFRYEGEIVPEP